MTTEDTVRALADTIQSQDPSASLKVRTKGPVASARLSRVRVVEDGEASVDSEIVLRERLGEGGMGVVRAAKQVPLDRMVAVKMLKRDHNESQRAALVKEAMITGSLEHPNITPVHLLARDEEGRPLLVMKQISGVSWQKMLDDADHPKWRDVIGDRLEWNLQVLMQVANAVSFAHNHGIIHRDLKPDNVMIGFFGEVYVLDWGVAFSLDEIERVQEETRRLRVAGTPAYMAPEMVDGGKHPVGVHTDVFLLGGILHQLIVGRPPNVGESLIKVLVAALECAPFDFPASAPKELVAIANNARARSPEDRFSSVEDFRRAITNYIQAKGALRLSKRAEVSLNTLKLERAKPTDEVDPVSLYRTFGACRFGFQEALATAETLPSALSGLRDALIEMIEFELLRGNADAAEIHLAELGAGAQEGRFELPEGKLESLTERHGRLKAESQAQAEELARLKGLERDLDVDERSGQRAWLVLGFSAVIILLGILVLERIQVFPLRATLYARFNLFLGIVLLGVVFRKSLMTNNATRRLGLASLIIAAGVVLNRLLTLKINVPVDQTFVVDQLLAGTAVGVLAVTLDRKLAAAAAVLVGGAILSSFYIRHVAAIIAGTLVIAMGCMVIAWRIGADSAVKKTNG